MVKFLIMGEYQLWSIILQYLFQDISCHSTFAMKGSSILYLQLWVNFWILGELLNYGWTLNYGWSFELKVNCLIIGELFHHGGISTVIYYFAVIISRDQLSFYLGHERTIDLSSSIMGGLLNYWLLFKLWVKFYIQFVNYGWTLGAS